MNVGTLTVRATMDMESYHKEKARAQRGAEELTRSLEHELRVFQMGEAEANRYEARLRGVADTTVRYNESLREQVEAHRQAAEAVAAQAAEQEKLNALISDAKAANAARIQQEIAASRQDELRRLREGIEGRLGQPAGGGLGMEALARIALPIAALHQLGRAAKRTTDAIAEMSIKATEQETTWTSWAIAAGKGVPILRDFIEAGEHLAGLEDRHAKLVEEANKKRREEIDLMIEARNAYREKAQAVLDDEHIAGREAERARELADAEREVALAEIEKEQARDRAIKQEKEWHDAIAKRADQETAAANERKRLITEAESIAKSVDKSLAAREDFAKVTQHYEAGRLSAKDAIIKLSDIYRSLSPANTPHLSTAAEFGSAEAVNRGLLATQTKTDNILEDMRDILKEDVEEQRQTRLEIRDFAREVARAEGWRP